MHRKVIFILLVISFFSKSLLGQDGIIKNHTRDFIWITPVKKNTTINGIAVGLLDAVPWLGADSLKINGLNLDVSFFGCFGFFYAFVGTIAAPFHRNNDTSNHEVDDISSIYIYTDSATSFNTKIKGISVSAGGIVRNTQVTGVALSGAISFAEKMQGFEITGVMNLHYEFKGMMIAGLRNKVTKGKGIQVALFNNCKKGQVLQIGLINRIGKRVIPFCNFSFKKLNRHQA